MRRLASSLFALSLLITLTFNSAPTLRAQAGDPLLAPALTAPDQAQPLAELLPEPAAGDLAAVAAEEPAPSTNAPVLQAAGDERWDERFAMPGLPEEVTQAAIGPNNTLYAVAGREIMHWDGRSWRSLGQADSTVEALTVFQGQVYVGGWFGRIGGFSVKHLARWDGTAWQQVVGADGPQVVDEFSNVNEGRIYALTATATTLYVGGRFNHMDGVPANSIAAWDGNGWTALGLGLRGKNFDGTPDDSSFSTEVRTLVAVGTTLYVGGIYEFAGASAASSIARWDGANWTALGSGVVYSNFGSPGPGTVYAIAVDGATVYVGGEFDSAGGQPASRVARYSGGAWAALGAGITADFSAKVYALSVEGGALLVGGTFGFAGGQAIGGLARYSAGAWSSLGGLDRFDTVRVIVPVPGGGQYIGGDFEQIGGVGANRIVRRNANAWKALGEGLMQGDNNCCVGRVHATVADGAGQVYVGGRFKTAGGVVVNSIGRWDGARWQTLGAGVAEGDVYALALVGETLYVGGDFKSAGGAGTPYLARYNLRTGAWSALGGGVNGPVYSLEYAAGRLYVGGDFDVAGGGAAYDLAVWDGAAWSSLSETFRIYMVFDSCAEQGTQVRALKVSGRYLAITGNFRGVLVNPAAPCAASSYRPVNHVMLYDMLADDWFLLGPQSGPWGLTGGEFFSDGGRALEAIGDLERGGALFVGGGFTQAGTVSSANLARLTLAQGWTTLGGVTGGTGSVTTFKGVQALRAAGATLFVGGNFATAGSGPAASVARYDSATNSWAALGSGVAESYHTINALAITPDGVFAGGEFEQAGGKPAGSVARYTAPSIAGLIAPSGGSLTGDGITLNIPSAAVAASTNLTLLPLYRAAQPAPSGQAIVRSMRLSASRGGQPVTSFSKPYSLKLTYTPALLAAAGITDPAGLKLAIWDGQKWAPIAGASLDTTARTISASTAHLGDIALIGTAQTGYTLYLPLLRR